MYAVSTQHVPADVIRHDRAGYTLTQSHAQTGAPEHQLALAVIFSTQLQAQRTAQVTTQVTAQA